MRRRSHKYLDRSWHAAVVGLALLINASQVLADPNPEREALASLIHEIEALEPLIATAESEANPDARIRLRYDWLREDLKRVRRGIQDQIDAPCGTSPPVPPLRGDYRR
jgi:RAQPRD family integrative conjugative element protein